jgi:hypothetical protein
MVDPVRDAGQASIMSAGTVERFVAKAKRELSSKERAAVAGELLDSLDYPGEDVLLADGAQAWRAEAVHRADRVAQGDVVGVLATKVHAAIRRKLRTKR